MVSMKTLRRLNSSGAVGPPAVLPDNTAWAANSAENMTMSLRMKIQNP
jgi:hypothetical protein